MTETHESSNPMMSYIVGGVLVVAVIAGGYFLRPKAPQPSTESSTQQTPTTESPIAGLSCDTQYYNPVIGFARYYLSVEGSSTTDASEVECVTTVTQENKVVATETVSVPLADNTGRGGKTFKCSTPALDLKPTIPTKVEVSLTDDRGATANCTKVFALPTP
jgi:hypothetical protein